MPFVHAHGSESSLLALYVQPRASKNTLVGEHDGALKVSLTTPPVDGKANKALLAFLAKALGRPKKTLSLKSGHQSRKKVVIVEGLAADELRGLLTDLMV